MALLSYGEWLEFTFGQQSPYGSMLTLSDYPGKPRELLLHCIRFFHEGFPASFKVSLTHLKRALLVLPSIDGYLGILAMPSLDTIERQCLCTAHVPLFKGVLNVPELSDEAFMWWESLRGAEYVRAATPEVRPPLVRDDVVICNTFRDVLTELLYCDSEILQRSALHGFNELYDVDGSDIQASRVIADFVASGHAQNSGIIEYARCVLSGMAP